MDDADMTSEDEEEAEGEGETEGDDMEDERPMCDFTH